MSIFLLNNPGVVFIHIPKTAGSAIRKGAFGGDYEGPTQGYVPEEWQDLFSFAFVRDPVERFLSAYRDKVLGPEQVDESEKGYHNADISFERFVEIALDESLPFKNDRASLEENIRHHTLPMTHPFNCLEQARFVGRFENLEEDFRRLTRYLRVSHVLPVRRSTSHHKDVANVDMVPPKILDKIKDYYKDDYRFLDQDLSKRSEFPVSAFVPPQLPEVKKKIPPVRGKRDLEGRHIESHVFGPLLRTTKSRFSKFSKGDLDRLPDGPALILHVDFRYVYTIAFGWCPLLDGLGRFVRDQRDVALQMWLYDERTPYLIEEKRDNQLHVIVGETSGYQSNLMHAHVSYLPGFWNFDELGVRNASAGRVKVFDQRAVHPPYATKFLTRLRHLYVKPASSNYKQPEPGSVALRHGSIVFFGQYFRRPDFNRDYMTTSEMIEAAIDAKGDRHFYIKPHPLQSDQDYQRYMQYHNPENGVEVIDANVHDLLDAADLTMSLSSGACFEGFMHRKPAILGGQTDFGQNAITLMNPKAMKGAIDATLEKNWPYAQFLTWYLKHHCLDNNLEAVPRALERIFRKGYDWADEKQAGFYGPER